LSNPNTIRHRVALACPRETTTVDAAGEPDPMLTRHERGLLIAGGCLYLTVLGFLTGMIVERVRFDRQRATVLQHLDATQERLHTHLMDLERQTQVPSTQR
jgi:hypothetical protein